MKDKKIIKYIKRNKYRINIAYDFFVKYKNHKFSDECLNYIFDIMDTYSMMEILKDKYEMPIKYKERIIETIFNRNATHYSDFGINFGNNEDKSYNKECIIILAQKAIEFQNCNVAKIILKYFSKNSKYKQKLESIIVMDKLINKEVKYGY